MTSASIHYGHLYDWFTQQYKEIFSGKSLLCQNVTQKKQLMIPFNFLHSLPKKNLFYAAEKNDHRLKKYITFCAQINGEKKNVQKYSNNQQANKKKSKGRKLKSQPSSFKCRLQFHTYLRYECKPFLYFANRFFFSSYRSVDHFQWQQHFFLARLLASFQLDRISFLFWNVSKKPIHKFTCHCHIRRKHLNIIVCTTKK